MADANGSPMVTLTVDGTTVEAESGELIIAAAERAGVFIPRFCYHPRMKPVGMCRMCLVEVSGPRGMTLQPACFLPVSQGQEIVTSSDAVKKAQDGVLELLLINHPLDCPVCDKGGECPLQDQTLTYGPGETRFVEAKRHWAKPIPLSPLVLLDRERCIQCARCTRFAEEIAGDPMIDFMARGDAIEVNIAPGEEFSSYFSGNTVQICPVGALTAKPYRFAARPWDLRQVESTCTFCAVGCRVAVQSSANKVIRLLGIDSDPVNQSWMCDKGRFAIEALDAGTRVLHPMVRRSGELVEVTWADAILKTAKAVLGATEPDGSVPVGVIGGARLANEDAYAWTKLAKSVIGTDSVDAQLADGLPADVALGLPKATLDDMASAACVIVLSPDLREEAPIAFLRLRAAAVHGVTKVIELATCATSVSSFAHVTLQHRPGEAGAVVRALVADVEPRPVVDGFVPPAPGGVDLEELARARALIAGAASAPDAPDAPDRGTGIVVVAGRPSLAESQDVAVAAITAAAAGLPGARFVVVMRRANTHGALDAGMAPGMLPGRVTLEDGRSWYGSREAWGRVPAERGMDSSAMLAAAADGELKVLFLLGSDPVADHPDAGLATRGIAGCPFIVAVTAHLTESARLADVVLPVAIFGERGGTTTNLEGRLSRLSRAVTAPGSVWDDWTVAAEIAAALGTDFGFESLRDIRDEIERVVPLYQAISNRFLDSPAAADGVVVPAARAGVAIAPSPRRPIDPMATPGIGSLTHHGARPPASLADRGRSGPSSAGDARPPGAPPVPVGVSPDGGDMEIPALDAYSLRLVSPRVLYDRGTHVVSSPALKSLAPEGRLRANHYDLDRLGASTGHRLRVSSARGSFETEVEEDDTVPRGVAVLGFNLAGARAGELIDHSSAVTDIRLEAL